VAQALLDARGAAHGARAPAAHVLVGRLVDERRLHEERVEVDPGALRAGVRDRALEHLLEDGSTGLGGELEKLEGLAGLTATNEIDHHTGLTRTDPREAGHRLADHCGEPFGAVVPTWFGELAPLRDLMFAESGPLQPPKTDETISESDGPPHTGRRGEAYCTRRRSLGKGKTPEVGGVFRGSRRPRNAEVPGRRPLEACPTTWSAAGTEQLESSLPFFTRLEGRIPARRTSDGAEAEQ
jgi:hypothetical protein